MLNDWGLASVLELADLISNFVTLLILLLVRCFLLDRLFQLNPVVGLRVYLVHLASLVDNIRVHTNSLFHEILPLLLREVNH